MTNQKSIGIHFIGLETRERAIFDRVIAFNITHGLKAHTSANCEQADLIVLSDAVFTQIEQYSNNKTLIVLNNDGSTSFGNIQIKRPLLITKVMNSVGDAIELFKTKLAENSSDSMGTSDQLEDVYIENHRKEENTAVEETLTAKSEIVENTVTETKNHGDQKSHHALIIDDSASIRKQLELELRDAGITTDFAESGEMALEKIKDNDKQFDLIFLDIIMPGIDGYETCKAMRSTAEYKKIPIIMLSGKTSPLDEVQGVIAGATTYLTKPVKSDKLQETLNRVTKWIDNFAESKKVETA
jgi:CheY-like chemotaxis protein